MAGVFLYIGETGIAVVSAFEHSYREKGVAVLVAYVAVDPADEAVVPERTRDAADIGEMVVDELCPQCEKS